MVRPEFYDYKYSDLDVRQAMREADRDKVLYDLEQQAKKNSSVTSNIGKFSYDYYKNNIDTIIEDDEYEDEDYVDEDYEIELLKDKYAKLSYKRDNYKKSYNNSFGISELVGYLWILGIILFIAGITTSDVGPAIAFGSLAVCAIITIIDKLYRDYNKSYCTKQIEKLKLELKQLRKEIKEAE